MTKKPSLNNLAKMMKKGFDETSIRFDRNEKTVDSTAGLLKLMRHEMGGMAKDTDMKEVKGTINKIYNMLDDETSFIQKMHAEYPIILKRLERIEKQLGLQNTITKPS